MISELPYYIEKPLLNETTEPVERIIIETGTLYPSPPKSHRVLTDELFTPREHGIYPICV